jgi:phosphoribosylamine--glycine ligase
MKRVLVVGGGGREHALAWKLASDSCVGEVFCAPGNAGTAAVGTNLSIAAEDVSGITAWAVRERPDLVVIGPEVPLCAGLSDALEAEGIRAFGPTAAAAQLEGSKVFAKEVMDAAGVPTAASASFTEAAPALAYVREQGAPIVVKAEGLAAGKGVTVCETVEQAEAAVSEALVDGRFGDAGARVLIEEFLVGEEASILGLIDGEHVVLLASSQDHKRALEGDQGPNTGGMGAYSPAPVVTDDLWPEIREQVFERTLAELRKRGIIFKGVLYAGLMISPDGALKVLEFNVRFGDPETQVVLPRMAMDLAPVFEACIDGTLSEEMVSWRDEHCVTVVMAAGGYPGSYPKGDVISGLDEATSTGAMVFHAGTALEGDDVVTAGGRVLTVTALGPDLGTAVARSYDGVAKIGFAGAQYRRDIAAKAL